MPTVKQKRTVIRIVENGGNVSQAMIDVGYSPATAKTPQKLTESDGFKELLDTYLPDDRVLATHAGLLNALDGNVAARAVDMAYKLKGSYAPEKSVSLEVKGNVKDFAKVDQLRAEYEA